LTVFSEISFKEGVAGKPSIKEGKLAAGQNVFDG